MLRNFWTIARRNLLRNRGYESLNMLGLAIGLACAFFIAIWIHHELSMDRFHEEADRTYAVMRHSTFGGERGTTRSMPKPLADALEADYAEVEHAVLVSWENTLLLSKGDVAFREKGHWAGPAFFNVFSFPLLRGAVDGALATPESITISRTLAERFFGADWERRDDILGSVIRLDNRADLAVTGVFEDVPSTSSLQFDFIIPIEEYIQRNDWVESWSNNGLRLFAQLREGADVAAFNRTIKDVIDAHHDFYESDVFLYPMTDLWLRSEFEDGVNVGGRIDYVYIFGLIALFILVIAGINFTNLATARSARRAREIGVRKTMGAQRSSLVVQFLGESLVKAGIACTLAMLVVWALFPFFADLTQIRIRPGQLPAGLWLVFGLVAIVTGLAAGAWPALYVSSFPPIGALGGSRMASGGGRLLQNGLVVLQFGLSIVLIVGTVTVYRQLDYIRTADLGVDREHMAMVRLEGGIHQNYTTFQYEAERIPGITGVTTSSNNPLRIGNDTMGVEWEGKDPDNNTLFWNASVNYDFVETMGMEMLDGRDFSRDFGADSTNYLINEEAAKAMGMTDPVGQQITFWDRPGTVIGLLKDFHMQSLYNEIRPVIFRLRPEDQGILFVRFDAANLGSSVEAFRALYARFNSEYPLEMRFMDEAYEESYEAEAAMGTLTNVFAGVAIFIACLGLFGLASYAAERRRREIGIRKVLGAGEWSVVVLMSRDFLLLVAAAFVVAGPLAWMAANAWLENFAYRIDAGVGTIIVVGVATATIALVTVGTQAVHSARTNPVEALRSD
ncbi:MAG: hypothetical protein COV99_02905 [Bacteroidetes bacterium CG12_big_fil_rev_8_21_14_0_65_60_17]|nr:MAG: hypothetical protein COV99_02905 [Bacteroidetes bacterium CG12_big_fil_rev_8_21_14_0_65_60_17]